MDMDSYDVKSLMSSKTAWGAIIAILAGVAGIFGYSIASPDQVEIVNIASSIASSLGGLIAIYGRVKATKKIG